MEKNSKDKEQKKAINAILIKGRKYRDPDYSAQKLAEDLGISAFQLARVLKKLYGIPYSDIILPLRIKDAQKYLLNPKYDVYTIEEIGIMVGFCNKWSFFQAFKKYVGMTPNVWRKKKDTPMDPPPTPPCEGGE